jgi:hypothetical protein
MKSMQPGRLALRVEGDMWNAYFAKPATMDGAILIGSIKMQAVVKEHRKEAFIALMRDVFSDLIEDIVGIRPTWPIPEGEPAPEHERSGSA